MKVSINSRRGSLPISKKQPKSNKINVVKPRKVLLLFATPLILVAMIVGGFYIKFQLDVTSAQAGMKEYLQNKYRQEFVVEKPEYKGGGLAVEGGWTANAYKNSDYKFLVHKGRKSYSDTYLSAFYNEQEAGSLRKIINILGIENYRHMTDIVIDYQVADNINNTPTLPEVLSRYGANITYGVYVIKTGDLPNQNDMKNLKALVEYVKSKNPNRYAVRYVINSRADDSRYLCHYYGGTGQNTNTKNLSMDCFIKYKGKE